MVFVAENFDGQLPPVPCSASMSRRSAAMSRLAACAIGAEVGCAQSVVGLVLNPELAEGKRTGTGRTRASDTWTRQKRNGSAHGPGEQRTLRRPGKQTATGTGPTALITASTGEPGLKRRENKHAAIVRAIPRRFGSGGRVITSSGAKTQKTCGACATGSGPGSDRTRLPSRPASSAAAATRVGEWMRPIAFSRWSTGKRWPGMPALTAVRRASTRTT
jgi:hypothetical protein